MTLKQINFHLILIYMITCTHTYHDAMCKVGNPNELCRRNIMIVAYRGLKMLYYG